MANEHSRAPDWDELLTEHQAARLLSTTERTLQTWRFRRAGPAWVRFGRAIRYQRREIQIWIQRNTVRT